MQKLPLAVVILAAGKGKRMKSDIPKVLHSLGGKPLLSYIFETVCTLKPYRIILIVNQDGEKIRSAFNDDPRIEFVEQKEQLGTGHAVMQARCTLESFEGNVLVLYGDMPFIKPETLENMIECRTVKQVASVLLTLKTSESRDFGRIQRDDGGTFCGIVEHKDADDRQKTIDEYNAGVYCFERSFLFRSVSELDNHNTQSEYYLTDTFKYFVEQNLPVHVIQIRDDREVFGVNSPEDLKGAERILAGFSP